MGATGRRFKLRRDYWDRGVYLYGRSSVTVRPGVTVLIGCNGSGKSTMLRQIGDQLKEENAAVVYLRYDKEREQKDMRLAEGMATFEIFASWAVNSEGEQIVVRLQALAGEVGNLVRRSNQKDLFVLLDGVDSGASLDNIVDMKTYLLDMLVDRLKEEGRDLYIIATANTYELSEGEDCIDVTTCQHRRFKNYEEYRSCVLESRKKKENRPSPKNVRPGLPVRRPKNKTNS